MDLKEDMSAMEVRLVMKNKGWQSNDRLTNMGWGKDENGNLRYGYSIWFERWDWHGVRGNKVCIHNHTSNLTKINKITYLAAIKCLRAWKEFTNSVPTQMADGNLEEDIIQTPFFLKSKREGKLNTKELATMHDKLMQRND
ncbi:hypothetical protein FDF50_16525 [Clostridium botulinum]|uniref:Uncharacterized protein n=1 Tax=Clostridium botulinum TaxID=1491 RepID=A0A6G4HPW9_CLOBO|nr:hypothetical protein [Clostridium botulinum]NFI74368.1 hypothetical protein [Clostridium sporogenes]AJE13376.1 hypothetical protein T259_3989 [Clostridium botulinum CDC_1436]MBO0572769.1 hypothetical protein [Clostridium botulinum]NFA60056.1 hypothetical protein [Clostridium botulinum]NFJ61684.1 hypothetical protein [Clostridium botulinum]